MILAVGVFATLAAVLGWLVYDARRTLERLRRAHERDREAWRSEERDLHAKLMFLIEKPMLPPLPEPTEMGPLPPPVFPDYGPEMIEVG